MREQFSRNFLERLTILKIWIQQKFQNITVLAFKCQKIRQNHFSHQLRQYQNLYTETGPYYKYLKTNSRLPTSAGLNFIVEALSKDFKMYDIRSS